MLLHHYDAILKGKLEILPLMIQPKHQMDGST